AEYLLRSLGRDPALPENAALVHYVAAAAITATAALNYYGVRWSALVLNLTTGAKYGALLLLVLLAFLVGEGDCRRFATADGAVPAGGGGRGAGGARPDRDRRSIGRGDARDLLDPRRVDPHVAPHLFRDGGRRAVLPRHREGASALPDALRGDRVDGLSGRGIRVAPHVRAAGRPVRGGDFSVLCARGGGGVRAAPPAPRSAPAGARARLSGGATAVRARDLRHSRERVRSEERRVGKEARCRRSRSERKR